MSVENVIGNRFAEAIDLNTHSHLVAVLESLVVVVQVESISFKQLQLETVCGAKHPNEAVAIACG